ncbi:MAG: outer membrane beta-barrel protein [Bacteroidota bacterium]
MTDNQFDNFVRAKLHDHSAPVPAGLWDKVNPAKDDDDRKGIVIPGKFRWGLPLLALLILAGSVTGYFIFSDDASGSITTGKDTVVQTGSQTGNATITETNTSNNNNNNKENTLPEDNDNTEATANITHADSKQDEANQQSGLSVQQQETDAADKTTTAGSATSRMPTNTNAENNIASSKGINNINISNNKRKTITPGSIESVQAFTKNAKNNTPIPFVRNANLTAKNDEAVISTTESTNEEMVYPVTFSGNFEPGNTISLSKVNFGLSGLMQREKINSAYSKKFRNIIVCPPYKVRNTDWFAEVYVSPDIAFKSIENRSATSQYLAKKDSSESMRLGYSAGVRIVKPITDNFLVKTGLQYTQINEKFTYRTEDEVKTITVISVRTIIRGPGDTLRVTDTSTVQQVGYKTNSIKNRYRSFDIPVTVGYQFGNENLQFGINAGVIFNISSWYQGVILDSSMAAVPISKGSNQVYKNNIGLGLYGGFSVLKRMGDNTQLFFEPYFRYNLSGITNGQASYQQKFSLGGLSVGLRYNLNRK